MAAAGSRACCSASRPPRCSRAPKCRSWSCAKRGKTMNHPATPLHTLTEKLIARKEGAIGWIIFNNPARHNATSYEMWLSLPGVLEAFCSDPEVRVIILRGEGEKAFSAGADISQFKQKRTGPEAVREYNAASDNAGRAL